MDDCCINTKEPNCIPNINIHVEGDECDSWTKTPWHNECSCGCNPCSCGHHHHAPNMYPMQRPAKKVNVSVNIDNRTYTKQHNPWPIGQHTQGGFLIDDCITCPDPTEPTTADPELDSNDGALDGAVDCGCGSM